MQDQVLLLRSETGTKMSPGNIWGTGNMAKIAYFLAATSIGFLSLSNTGNAQQLVENVDRCLKVVTPPAKFEMTNACDFPITLQFYDFEKKVAVERNLKPKETIPGIASFGATCPAGYVSDVPITPQNRERLAKNDNKCVKR